MIILRAGFSSAHATAAAVFLAALVVLFCGFAFQIGRLVFGPPRDSNDQRVPLPERFDLGMAMLIAVAIVAFVSGFYLPGSMLALIRAATDVVWRSA
jgi:hypothetical protein